MQTDPGRRDDGENGKDKNIANVFLFVFFLLIVGIGVWLANGLIDARNLDDCVAQGRRNCAPIDLPTRAPR